MLNESCREFIDKLASAAPVPGGGGASALVGALGVALGSMVGNLTLGKKKYDSVQQDIQRLLADGRALQEEMEELVTEDAMVFEPLAKAYGMPKNTDEEKQERERVMEQALRTACSVPLKIMACALKAIAMHEELAEKGSRLAVSDVGVGVLFCKSALFGASLNVYINTSLMTDRETAHKLEGQADQMLKQGGEQADKVYADVMRGIRK
ncbi:MAG TPA: sugar ABC transporter substrate-binding protein [Clostridiales bacterium]|nr:sugar ABC transporter substrate-binding protein [Clostridiales bacterium]